MANEKIVKLDHLNIIKNYIDSKDSDSIKSAEYADNTIKLYNTIDMSGEAAVTLNLPEEMFLDQTKTVFVPDFSWVSSTYPGSENPNLDGKPVMVLAVKGGAGAKYSFVSLEKLGAKVSAEAGNALVMKEDGFYVSAPPDQTIFEYASDEEIQALFSE